MIVKKVWMSTSSAAMWSRRNWMRCLESRKRTRKFPERFSFQFQVALEKEQSWCGVLNFCMGGVLSPILSAQISRAAQDVMLWKIKLKLPSKLHSYWVLSQHYPSKTLNTPKGTLHKGIRDVFQGNLPRIPIVVKYSLSFVKREDIWAINAKE